MEKKRRKIAAVLSIVLACVLLVTELPRILNAAEMFQTAEQGEVQEPVQEDGSTDGEEPQTSDAGQDASGKDEADNNAEGNAAGEDANPDEQTDAGKQDEVKKPVVGKAKASLPAAAAASETGDETSSGQVTAQDIEPVPNTDPMYWMGQRTGGDTNRAMVWFGEYWQDKEASKKSPVLWRTLRSDGQGNYGGAVTLLSEYAPNNIAFDEGETPFNQHWCNSLDTIKSSDIRAYLNGVGTGAMDAAADFPSRSKNRAYNEVGGGAGNKKGSFYTNAFDNSEKNLIMPTYIEKEQGYKGTNGRDVADKIFILNGYLNGDTNMDALNPAYFGDDADRMCILTDLTGSPYSVTSAHASRGNLGEGSWFLRSPYHPGNRHQNLVKSNGVLDWGGNFPVIVTRPSLNLKPSTILYSPASEAGGDPTNGDETGRVVGLNISNGAAVNTFETDIFGSPVYNHGASYRIFKRDSEDSNLGISNGEKDGEVILSYPEGSAGQYISVMVVNDVGEKWTGRVKHIENNEKGTVEFFVPQRNPGTSTTQKVRVFAWRETEETKTACVPNYEDITLKEAPAYKITYNDGGGTNGAASIDMQSIIQGADAVLKPCTFKKTKNYFVGWRDESGKMYSNQEVITPSSDLTLTAIWSDSYKTITYKPGSGSGSDVTFNGGTGSVVTLPDASFTPPGNASFIEWNTVANGSGTSYKAGDKVTLDDNLTLYAIYGTKATITYEANGGTGDTQTQDGYLEKDFTLKSDGFTRPGYTLTGWNTAADGKGTGYELGAKVTLTGDCTLYAQWEAIGYKLSFNSNGAAQGDAPKDISLTYGGTATIPDAAIYRNEHVFDGWTVNSDGTGTVYKKDDTIPVDENFPAEGLTLYAKWADAANYCITYDLNKPAAAADSDVEGTMPLDDLSCFADGINTKTSAAEPGVKIKGYVFKGWSTSELTPPGAPDLTAPKDELTPTADLTLHAIWASATEWKVTYTGTTTGVTGNFPKDAGPYYDDGSTYKITVKDNDNQTKTGYTFKGWSETEDSTTAEHAVGSEITLSGDLTLHAVWEANDCKVTYDRNASAGSGNAPSPQTGKYGTEFTVSDAPANMKNPGGTFNGWNTKEDGSGKSYTAGQTYSFTGDITLYAQWTDSQYQIVFNGNGSEKGTVPASLTPAYKDEITIPNAGLCKTGVIFDGWNTRDDGKGTSYAANAKVTIDDSFPTGTTTLYTKWKDAETYKLSYNTNAGEETVTGDLPADTDYDADGITNVVNVTNVIPVRKGYTFTGWSTTADGTVSYTAGQKFTLKKDTTLYAVWSQGTFALIYHFNGGTDTMHGTLPATVTGGPTTKGIKAAGQGDLKRDCYKFTGWNTESDGSGTDYKKDDDITLNENIDLYAQWQSVQEATLTYNKNCLNAETIMPSADGGHYDDGLSQEATISTDKPIRHGYEFKGWSLDKDELPDSTTLLKGGDKITVTSDTTIYAIWELGTYTLKYDKNIKTNDPDQIEGSWPADVTGNVTMAINTHDGKGFTRPNYTIKEWNTKSDGKGTSYGLDKTYSLIADATLYAIWEPATYTIHYDGGADDVTGTVPADHSGKYKASYQAAQSGTMAKAGYGFSGWNDKKDGSGNSYTPGATYQYLENKTLYAQWSQNVWTIKFDISSAEQGDAIDDITGSLNAALKLPDGSGLKKTHATFNGWNTAPDGASGTSYAAGGTLTIQDSTPKSLTLYAKWKTANTYKLTYNKNGSDSIGNDVDGTLPSAVTCYNDKMNHQTVIPTNSLTRKGYSFAGWSETKNGTVKYYPGDTIDMVEEGKDITLYAVWTQETFKLMYDANATDIKGTVPAAVTGSVTSEIKAADQGSMYRAKYKFLGWNTEADGSGTTIQPETKITLDKTKVLYAVWQPLTAVHVTYDSGCDDLTVNNTLPKDTKDYYDDGINGRGNISTIKPIRHGYTFSYWSTQENGAGTRYNGGEDIKVTQDLTLYAVWDMGNYTLTYKANANDVQGVMPPNKYGTVLSSIKAEDNAGFSRPYYTFKGWNTKSDGTGMTYQPGDDISLGRDIILYAQWRETVYKVTFDLNSPVISQAEGTVPGNMQGTHLEKFKTPEQGDLTCKKYRFTGWNTDPDGAGEQFQPGEEYRYEIFEDYGEEVTLYANWVSVPPFEVMYLKNANDAEGDEPVDSNLYIPEDGTNLATVLGPGSLKRKGYEFVCWTTKKDGSGSRYVEGSRFYVTAHTVLYAQWTPGTYTLTYNKNGTDVTGKAPASIRSSSQENIKAAGPNTMKKKNHEFLGWSTKASASKPTYKEGTKFRILEDTTVYAIWRKLINVSIDHTEGLVPSANNVQSVSQGSKLSEIKLPAVKEGYQIEGWIVNGQKVTNPKEYVLEKDAEVQAIVKKKPKDDNKGSSGKDDEKDNNSGGNSGSNGSSGGNNSGTSSGSSNGSGSGGSSSGQGSTGGSGYSEGSANLATKAGDVKISPDKSSKHKAGQAAPEGDTNINAGKSGSLTTIADESTPLSGGAAAAANDNSLAGHAAQKNCVDHWFILFGILVNIAYILLRCIYIRKRKLIRSEFLTDTLLPLLAVPLAAAAYLYRACSLDVKLIIVWLVIAAAGIYADRKIMQNNAGRLEALLLQEEKEMQNNN